MNLLILQITIMTDLQSINLIQMCSLHCLQTVHRSS